MLGDAIASKITYLYNTAQNGWMDERWIGGELSSVKVDDRRLDPTRDGV